MIQAVLATSARVIVEKLIARRSVIQQLLRRSVPNVTHGSMGRLPIKAWASVAIVTIALASAPAYAADGIGVCGTIRLAETAVAMLDNQPIVKVFANSATVLVLLDTGAEATVLTPAAAQRIGAQHRGVKLGRQMHGITGDIPAGELELRSFTIGGVEVPRKRVRVAPIEIVNALSGPLDGVLGADTLSSFDIDLDLPGRRMTLYQGQSCAAASPAWAQPYARIAASRTPSNRLYFPVQLDGRRISAGHVLFFPAKFFICKPLWPIQRRSRQVLLWFLVQKSIE